MSNESHASKERRPERRTPRPLTAVSAALIALLAGCQSYNPQALDTSTPRWSGIERVTVDPNTMSLPQLAAHRFDPSDGLDIIEVQMLAVAHNPDLRLARTDLKLARAQAFSAGLLPDPLVNLTADFPHPQQPGLSTAFNA